MMIHPKLIVRRFVFTFVIVFTLIFILGAWITSMPVLIIASFGIIIGALVTIITTYLPKRGTP